MRRASQWLSMGVALAAVAARPSPAADLRDLYFGEALYQAYQGQYFDALDRLDSELAQHRRLDEPELDSLQYHIRQADFSVGDFELRYRMHLRAGRAIKQVLDADVDQPVKNDAAYRLARIEFQNDQPEDALHALERIQGTVPDNIRDDVEFLRANVYLALGRPADAADVLKRLQTAQSLKGFAAYNLGIALLQSGHAAEGLRQLDKAGQIDSRETATAAIRDKSNMVLGSIMLRSDDYAQAQQRAVGLRLQRMTTTRQSYRGECSSGATQPMPRSRRPGSRCRSPTASCGSTGARRVSMARRSIHSARSWTR